jgi:hypothetical protein
MRSAIKSGDAEEVKLRGNSGQELKDRMRRLRSSDGWTVTSTELD